MERIRFIIVFILFIFQLSCQKEVKEVRDLQKKAPEPQTIGRTNEMFDPQKKENKEVYAEYLRRNNVQSETRNNREIMTIGGVRIADVKADPRLIQEGGDTYLVTLNHFSKEVLEEMKKSGIEAGYYIPDNSLIVRVKSVNANLSSLPAVKSCIAYQPYMKIAKSDGEADLIRKAKVSLWGIADTNDFNHFCKSNSIRIVRASGKDFIIDTTNIRSVLFQDCVLRVEKYYESGVFSVSGNQVGKSLYTGVNAGLMAQISELPENVAVYDVGVDSAHPDLKGVLRDVYESAGDGNPGEFVSHGTHIAGIIAGNGYNSIGKTKGVNPAAKVLFFSMGDDLTGLMVPPSMGRLFDTARQKNTVIANLSWGTYDDGHTSRYMSISRDIDDYVYQHPEMIVVAAAGNDGKSIASPATAKNVISVGALDGADAASYSGRNGCSDGRVKPDIMLQGSGIESLDLNGGYTEESGTSQAAAAVSGIISKLFFRLDSAFGIKPTQSLVKAILTANTLETNASKTMGFGRLYFSTPIDNHHFNMNVFHSLSDIREVKISLNKGDTLSVVLCWTEPPVSELAFEQLIDDLDLEVLSPSGRSFTINDRLNNVERIFIPGTEEGEYTIRVKPFSAPYDLNDIALVLKSAAGFAASPVAQNFTNTLSSQPLVDLTQNSSGNITAPVTEADQGDIQTGSTGISAGLGSTTATASVSASSMPALSYGITDSGDLSGDPFQSLSSTKTNQSAVIQTIYFHGGMNYLDTRALGAYTNRVVGLNFNAGGIIAGGSIIPVGDVGSEYQNIPVNIGSNTNGAVLGSVLVSSDANGTTNNFPVWFSIDPDPPVLGDRYPSGSNASFNVLTNTAAWISLTDAQSGVGTNMVLAVNGTILATNQYAYNYGTGRLSLYFDRIMSGLQKQNVKVDFVQVPDMAGNVMSKATWSFVYELKSDITAPEKPTGLAAVFANKQLRVDWNPNAEKDIWGYHIYLVGSDILDSRKMDTGILITNHFETVDFTKYSSNIENLGVTAVDYSTNESEMAVVHTGVNYANNPPKISITGVPAITNGTVIASVSWMDEGYLIMTNVRLNGKPAVVSWNGNVGTMVIDQSGNYELSAEVMDDDSNDVTNIVNFTIDHEAPGMPAAMNWTNFGTAITLYWSPVIKTNDSVTYNVLMNGSNIAAGVLQTNLSIDPGDYGKFMFAVSAVDSLGNESARNYTLANTEKGIRILNTNVYYSRNLPLSADVMLSTNRYQKIEILLSNRDNPAIAGVWEMDRAFAIQPDLDVSGMADGQYILTVEASMDGKTNMAVTNIVIDNTPPSVMVIAGGKTNSGNYFVLRPDTDIGVQTLDNNFDRMELKLSSGGSIVSLSNMTGLPDRSGGFYEADAFDKAGNAAVKRIQMVFDSNTPAVQFSLTNQSMIGRIWDENLQGFDVVTNKGIYYHSDYTAEGQICQLPSIDGTLGVRAWDWAGNTNYIETNVSIHNQDDTNSVQGILVNGSDKLYINSHNIDIDLVGSLSSQVEYSLWDGKTEIFSSGMVKKPNYGFSGLNDGIYTVTAVSSDFHIDKDVIIDTIPPAIGIKSYLTKNTPLSNAYRITDENPDTVAVMLNKVAVPDNTVLMPGEYSIDVGAVDKAGNTNSVSGTLAVSEGDSGREEILVDFKHSQIIWLASSGRVITNSFPAFSSGTQYFSKPLMVRAIGGVLYPTYSLDGNVQNTNLYHREGMNAIGVRADGTSGEVYQYSFNAVLDFTPPAFVTTITNGGVYAKLPEVRFDDAFGVTASSVKMDGMELWQERFLSEGLHTIEASATDHAGNTNYQKWNVILDRVPPEINCDIKEGGLYSKLPGILVYDANPGEQKIFIDGTNWSSSILSDGIHRLDILAVDLAGNSNSYKISRFNIDSVPPSVQMAPAPGVYREAKPLFTYSKTNMTKTLYYINGKAGTSNIIMTNEGKYNIALYAEDSAGNNTNISVLYTIDRTAPIITVSNLIDGSSYLNGYIPIVQAADQNLGNTTVLLDDKAYTNDVITNAGKHTLKINALDLAGNMSSTNLSFDIVEKLPEVFINGLGGVYAYGRFINNKPYGLDTALSYGRAEEVKFFVNNTPYSNNVTIDQVGKYSVYARVKTALGENEYQVLSPRYQLELDTSAPKISILGIEEGGSYSGSVPLEIITSRWTKDFSADINGFDFLPVAVIATNGENAYDAGVTLTLDSGVLKAGDNILNVNLTDILGQSAASKVHFTVNPPQNNYPFTPGSAPVQPGVPAISVLNYNNRMIVSQVRSRVGISDPYLDHYTLKIYSNDNFIDHGYALNSNASVIDLSFINGWGGGDYRAEITAVNRSKSASTNLYITLDRTLPVVTIANITNHGIYRTPGAEISIDEAHFSNVIVKLDSTVYDSNETDFSVNNLIITHISGEGFHTLEVSAEDAAGNSTNAEIDFTVDTLPPQIAFTGAADKSVYNNPGTVGMNLSDENPSGYSVTNMVYQGTRAMTSVANGTGRSLSIAGTQGSNVIAVSAWDVVSNRSYALISFTVETNMPVFAMTIPESLTNRYDLVVSNINVFGGVGLSNISVKLNGAVNQTVNFGNVTSAGLAFGSGLRFTNEGRYDITVDVCDNAGNHAITNVGFTLDTTPPTLAILSNNDGKVVKQLTAIASADDLNYQGMVVQINQSINYTNAGKDILLSDTLGGWTDGAYRFDIAAFDKAGNSTATNIHTTIDTTLPSIAVSGVTNNGYYPWEAAPSISVNDANLSNVQVFLNDVLANSVSKTNTSFAFNPVLSNGTNYSLKVAAVDMAGNTNSAEVDFTVDRTLPAIRISGVTNGGLYKDALSADIQVYDLNLDSYAITNLCWTNLDGTGFKIASYTGTNGEILTIPLNQYTNALIVCVKDKAGLTNMTNIGFAIDQTPPLVIIITNGYTNGIFAKGSSYIEARVYDYRFGQFYVTNYFSNSGGWTVKDTAMLNNSASPLIASFHFNGYSDGLYRLDAFASDAAGYSNSRSFSYMVDTTAPDIKVDGFTNSIYYNCFVTNTISITDANIDITACSAAETYTNLSGQVITSVLTGTNLLFIASNDGAYLLTVNAADQAGNTNCYQINFMIDRQAPTVQFLAGGTIAPTNFYTNSLGLTVTNYDSGYSGLSNMTVVMIINNITNSPYSEGFNSSVNINFGIQSFFTTEGSYTIVVDSYDKCGNHTTNSYSFTIDSTPPEVNFSVISKMTAVYNPNFSLIYTTNCTLNDGGLLESSPNNFSVEEYFKTIYYYSAIPSPAFHNVFVTLDDSTNLIKNICVSNCTLKGTNLISSYAFTNINHTNFCQLSVPVDYYATMDQINRISVTAIDDAGNEAVKDFYYQFKESGPNCGVVYLPGSSMRKYNNYVTGHNTNMLPILTNLNLFSYTSTNLTNTAMVYLTNGDYDLRAIFTNFSGISRVYFQREQYLWARVEITNVNEWSIGSNTNHPNVGPGPDYCFCYTNKLFSTTRLLDRLVSSSNDFISGTFEGDIHLNGTNNWTLGPIHLSCSSNQCLLTRIVFTVVDELGKSNLLTNISVVDKIPPWYYLDASQIIYDKNSYHSGSYYLYIGDNETGIDPQNDPQILTFYSGISNFLALDITNCFGHAIYPTAIFLQDRSCNRQVKASQLISLYHDEGAGEWGGYSTGIDLGSYLNNLDMVYSRGNYKSPIFSYTNYQIQFDYFNVSYTTAGDGQSEYYLYLNPGITPQLTYFRVAPDGSIYYNDSGPFILSFDGDISNGEKKVFP